MRLDLWKMSLFPCLFILLRRRFRSRRFHCFHRRCQFRRHLHLLSSHSNIPFTLPLYNSLCAILPTLDTRLSHVDTATALYRRCPIATLTPEWVSSVCVRRWTVSTVTMTMICLRQLSKGSKRFAPIMCVFCVFNLTHFILLMFISYIHSIIHLFISSAFYQHILV